MNWLPRDGLLRPVCCTRDNPPTKVSELIDPMTLTWNLQVVEAHFLPMDQELIRSIPLSGRWQEDFWAWHYERTRVFTVKSAYQMLISNRERRADWIEHNPGRSDIAADQKRVEEAVVCQGSSEGTHVFVEASKAFYSNW